MGNWSSRLAFITLIVLMTIVILSGPAGFAQQPPGIPMIVSGQVTLNGTPAPDGYNITAWDNGAVVGSTLTSGGNYSVSVCGEAGQTCSQDDTISFQLDQLTTSQTTSLNRGFPVTLNLAFTGTPSAQPQQVTAATTQPSVTEAQTTAAVTSVVTVTSSVTTPEYPNYLSIMLVALLITVGLMIILHRRNRRT